MTDQQQLEADKQKRAIFYAKCTSEFKDEIPSLTNFLKTGTGFHTKQEAGYLLWYHALVNPGKLAEVGPQALLGAILSCLEGMGSGTNPALYTSARNMELSVCTGLLLAYIGTSSQSAGEGPTPAEVLAKMRVGNGAPAVTVLLNVMLATHSGPVVSYLASLLKTLACADEAKAALLKTWEGSLPGCAALLKFSLATDDSRITRAVFAYFNGLLAEGPGGEHEAVVDHLIAVGGVEATLTALKTYKGEGVCAQAACMLQQLLRNRDTAGWKRFSKVPGALNNLIDLLGPPSPEYLMWERSVIQEEKASAAAASISASAGAAGGAAPANFNAPPSLNASGQFAPGQLSMARRKAGSFGSALAALGGSPAASRVSLTGLSLDRKSIQILNTEAEAMSSRRPLQAGLLAEGPILEMKQRQQQKLKQDQASGGLPTWAGHSVSAPHELPVSAGARNGDSGKPLAEFGEVPDEPPPPPSPPLSENSVALKWPVTGPRCQPSVAAPAAACLYVLTQDPHYYCAVMDERQTAYRLVEAMKVVAGPENMAMISGTPLDDGDKKVKKKSKKKKGISLSAEQSRALTSMTGALKMLSLSTCNRYRIAQLGALPLLKALHEGSSTLLLRRNAQAVIASVAMLAENGQLLMDASISEEFLVTCPLRLTPVEIQILKREFPSKFPNPEGK